MSVIPGLGLATSVVGNIVGGVAQAQIAEKQQQALDGEKAYSESLFNKEYYQDVMKRSENAAFLRELKNNQKENKNKAAKTAAITGATPEATATQDKNDGDIYANAVNRMAGLASQRKDMALAGYNHRRSGLFRDQNQIEEGKKAAWGTFMSNANSLGAGSIAGMTEGGPTSVSKDVLDAVKFKPGTNMNDI